MSCFKRGLATATREGGGRAKSCEQMKMISEKQVYLSDKQCVMSYGTIERD